MKILVISLYYSPDHTGIANYASSFAKASGEKGHDVQVVTGFSFYPKWRKRKEDRRVLYRSEINGKVKVLRNYLYVPQKPTTVKRIIQEISFLFFATLGLFRVNKPDVIVCFTTPILLGFWSSVVAKLFRSRLIINVQDFQLEAALSLGMTKPSTITRILEWFEVRSYRSATYVSSITESMCNILTVKKKLDPEKVLLWPNWINPDQYDISIIEQGTFRNKNGIDKDTLVVCYAGNIGLKQGLENLVKIAASVGENRKILFLIIGNGAALPYLQEMVKEDKLEYRVRFMPLLSADEYPCLLKDIDLFVLPQKKTAFDVYFPSKLMGILLCRVPLLLLADKDSELYRTVQAKDVGSCFEFDDLAGTTAFMAGFDKNSQPVKERVEKGVQFANEFDEKKVIAEILNKIKNEN
jgi:colanic acid biosynthesis glycosyl transferase WcaI